MATKIPLQLITVTMILAMALIEVNSKTLESDIEVLRLLKQSIDPVSIPPYSYINSWNFSADPCESTRGFLGVLCSFPLDNSSHRIIALDLDASGYDGFLTPSIGNLTELTTISLSKNNFRGPIPESISNLKKITRISFSGNLFTGNIPNGITMLKKLRILELSQTHLSGTIPARISGLRSLTRLSLSNNTIYGRIPDLSGMWQLKSLDLSYNQLFGNLPGLLPVSLRTIYLNNNVLSGHISPLNNLKNLKALDLSDNRFAGRILQEVLSLPKLVRMNVSVNQFTALEPIQFPPQDSQLQILDAHSNRLRGRLPISLAALGRLTALDLSHNQFFGPIPADYGAKRGSPWRRLFLDDNFLLGNLPTPFLSSNREFRGSLAHNCLRCPNNSILCRGGQRPHSECIGRNDIGR